MTQPLLTARGLTKEFPAAARRLFGRAPRGRRAVDDVSFDLFRGETLGLVGESGCGKSTTARLLLRLIEPSAGSVVVDGTDVTRARRRDLRALRAQMQMVFQDPLSSLNPRMTVGTNVAEPLRFHGIGTQQSRREAARELFEVVGLQPRDIDRYPHEFSGGQCQRVAIARALVLKPKLIIFDEPVSALDVSIRAQILRLLLDMQERFNLTYILISHDLSVVKRVANRIAVMYLGRIVEIADGERVLSAPLHPYTQSLISAIPVPDPRQKRITDFAVLEGDLPSGGERAAGCAFRGRCRQRMAACATHDPALLEVRGGHRVACLLHGSEAGR